MDLKIGDKLMAYDGEDIVENEKGQRIFEATSLPHLDELGIPCIEVREC